MSEVSGVVEEAQRWRWNWTEPGSLVALAKATALMRETEGGEVFSKANESAGLGDEGVDPEGAKDEREKSMWPEIQSINGL